MTRRLLSCLLLAFVLTPSLYADSTPVVLLNYDIAAVTGDRTNVEPNFFDDRLRPEVTAPEDFTPEQLTRSGLSGGVGNPGFFSGRGWATSGDGPVDPLADSTDPRALTYFEVRVIIPPPHRVQLNRVVYSLFREDFQGLFGADTWELHASDDGFNEHSVLVDTIDASGVPDYFDGEFLTVESSLESLPEVGEVSLRWFAYGGASRGPGEQFVAGFAESDTSGADVTVFGTFIIPEPASLGLVLVSAGLVGVGRRRR